MLVQVRLPGLSTSHVGLTSPLYFVSLGASVLAVTTGLGLILDPVKTSKAFGLSMGHTNSEMERGYAAAAGARNIVLGLSTLYFTQADDRRAVVISVVSGVALAISNGIIVLRYGEKNKARTAAMRHFIGATLSAVFVCALLV